MATTRTGAHAFIKYGYETTFNTAPTVDKKFGLNDRVTSWSLTHNRIDIPALNQTTIHKYAYGQQSGTLGVSFNLSNPWVFGAIYGQPAKTGSSPFNYTYPSSAQPKEVTSMTCQVNYDGSDADIVREVNGCIANSLNISTSVGEIVDCSMDMTYGKENAPATTVVAVPSKPAEEFAYTFAHGVVKVGGNTLATVQDVDITFGQNAELLYGIGSNQSVNTYRRIFDITGNFRASWLNKNLLEGTLAQIGKNTSTTYEETIGGSPEFELTFQNTASGATSEIKITGTGLAPTDLGISGIAPVEPIFENISWRIKSATVVAKSTQTAAE